MEIKDDGITDVGILRRQLLETRSAQSGSDRRVTELVAEKAALEEKLAEMEKGEDPKVVAMREKESQLDRRERALNSAIAYGVKPQRMIELLGLDGADVETQAERIAEYGEKSKLEGKNEVAMKHGRTITKTSLPMGPTNYGELHHMTDEAIDAAGGIVNDIMDKEIKASKPTFRDKIKAGRK